MPTMPQPVPSSKTFKLLRDSLCFSTGSWGRVWPRSGEVLIGEVIAR